MWGKRVTHWTANVRHWWSCSWRGVCGQTMQPPAWSQLPSRFVFRDYCWRGMEKLPKFCLFMFHGFVAEEMTAMRTESRLGHPPKQHPWPFSGGCVRHTGWLLMTICSFETLNLRTRMCCCCWPEVQPFSRASKSFMARIHKHMASEKFKRFFSRIWGLTGMFSHFIKV